MSGMRADDNDEYNGKGLNIWRYVSYLESINYEFTIDNAVT